MRDQTQQHKHPKFHLMHSRIGRYHALVRDNNRGVNYLLTLGPHYLCFISLFLVVNLISAFLLYKLKASEQARLYYLVYLVVIINLDVSWLICALINPGIATEQDKPGSQICQQCQIRHRMTIPKKQGRFHCRRCSICIDNYKYHCYFSGNCVGKNNFIVSYFMLLGILLWIIVLAATLPYVYYL